MMIKDQGKEPEQSRPCLTNFSFLYILNTVCLLLWFCNFHFDIINSVRPYKEWFPDLDFVSSSYRTCLHTFSLPSQTVNPCSGEMVRDFFFSFEMTLIPNTLRGGPGWGGGGAVGTINGMIHLFH